MRIRPRALGFAVVFLVLADIILRAGVLPVFPADFRLPARTLMGYDAYLGQMRDSDRVRVAVVGDSVVAGQFADRSDTLPAHLDARFAADGRAADAYNLGLPGAQAVDLYAVVADIAEQQAADVVVINMDYRFYGREVPAPRYPELWDRLARTGAPAGQEPSIAPAPAPTLASRIGDRVSSIWRLYGERDALSAAAFGEIPRRQLTEAVVKLRLAIRHIPRFAKKSDADLPMDDLRAAYDVPAFAGTDSSITYLGGAIELCAENDIDVIVFAGPLDRALLDRNRIVDWERYSANIAWMRTYAESRGATFVDMTDALPSDLLGDSHHPLGPGYARMADVLGGVLAPTLDRVGAPAEVTP